MYIDFILFVLCGIGFRFSTMKKQNAQSCSLDILEYNNILNNCHMFRSARDHHQGIT